MDLGEIAHLPKPITPHVNFSSFVFNILLLDFSFPRWSVNLAFSTSFFTVLLRAGAKRSHSPQWFFYNISCYSSKKFSNLRYLHHGQILSWNSFLYCAPTFPSSAHILPVTASKAPEYSILKSHVISICRGLLSAQVWRWRMVLEVSRPGAFSYLDLMEHPDDQAEQKAAGAG